MRDLISDVLLAMDRSTEILPSAVESELKKWSLEDDKVLIQYVDELAKNLSASPQRLNPEEIFWESDFTNPGFESLKRKFHF